MAQQNSSVQTAIVIGLVVVVLGLLGFVFWQNYMIEDAADSKTSVSNEEKGVQKKGIEERAPEAIRQSKISTAKVGIESSMRKEGYEGLEIYMAPSVDGALAYSDGFFEDASPAKVTSDLYAYFNNEESPVKYAWNFSDFEEVGHENFKKMAAESSGFDFDGSYVAVGSSSDPAYSDVFVAYRINDAGLVTDVFYGMILA